MINKNSSIYFSGAIQKVGNAFWISLLEYNGLIKIDICTGKIEFIDVFQGEQQDYQLHSQILQYQNKLIFIPWNACNIVFYDLNSKNLRYLSANTLGKAGRYITGFADGSVMYLVEETALKIIKIDIETEVILENYELECKSKREIVTHISPFILNGEIWKISEDKDFAWKFNIYSKKYSRLNWNIKQDGNFIGRCIGNNFIWIIAENDLIYQLTEEGICKERYDISTIMNVIFGEKKREYIKCSFLNKSLIIIAYDKNSIIKIPVIENALKIEMYEYQQFEDAFFVVEDGILIILFGDKIIYIDDTVEQEIVFYVSSNFFSAMIEKNKNAVKEKNICKLKDYLQFLCECNEIIEKKCCNRIIGKDIFEQCI